MKSQFKKWKCRASSMGHICTKRETITKDQLADIKALEDEKETGLNANGNKVKWTDNKENKLSSLISKRDAPDELPAGVKTHLDNVFRSQFWGRNRILFNKYLDKGNLAEEDSLELLSQIDGTFYAKNDDFFENAYAQGTPDNIQGMIRDAKTNFDMESFDNAELTSLYKWQVKTYIWMLISKLKNYHGELFYALVNNPYHQLNNDITSMYYKMGQPDDDDDRYMEYKRQMERNMIFDIKRWKENYPGYPFVNENLDFDVPAVLRIKRFPVTLNNQDIKFMKQRVVMCRDYLIEKENEVLNKLKRKKC